MCTIQLRRHALLSVGALVLSTVFGVQAAVAADPSDWDEVLPLSAVNDAETGARLAYAAFLATEPADFAAAEAELVNGARWFAHEPAFVRALFVVWRHRGLTNEQITRAITARLAAAADANPAAPYLNLVVGRAERQLGQAARARKRLYRCLKRNRWRHAELFREWLLTLDANRHGTSAAARIADFQTEPGLYGNWIFERAAADFLHDFSLTQALPARRQLQLRAWRHRLRAARDPHQQATAATARPLLELLLRVERYPEAAQLTEQLAASNRASLHSERIRAHLMEKTGRWLAALAVWESLIATRDTIAAYHLGRARCLDALNQPRPAADALAAASRVTINPKYAIPLGLEAAQRYLAFKLPDKALAVLAGLPSHPSVYLLRANALIAKQQPDDAVATLTRARETFPQSPQLLERLAETLYSLHEFPAAEDLLSQALPTMPAATRKHLQPLLARIRQALATSHDTSTLLPSAPPEPTPAIQ